jgi:NTP pyrophosphatase (non-canonical NTP hydrolase)
MSIVLCPDPVAFGEAAWSSYDPHMDIPALQQQLADFSAERDWDQFHSPKNLAMALAAEAGELLEVFQWLSEQQSERLNPATKRAAAQELADVLIYLLRLADRLDVDLETAVADKIRINAAKYPVALAKGNATKASRRD